MAASKENEPPKYNSQFRLEANNSLERENRSIKNVQELHQVYCRGRENDKAHRRQYKLNKYATVDHSLDDPLLQRAARSDVRPKEIDQSPEADHADLRSRLEAVFEKSGEKVPKTQNPSPRGVLASGMSMQEGILCKPPVPPKRIKNRVLKGESNSYAFLQRNLQKAKMQGGRVLCTREGSNKELYKQVTC